MKMKLPFFSQVRVVRCERFPSYEGKLGVVIGVSEEDGEVRAYSVQFPYSADEGLDMLPEEIVSTGKIVERSLIYDDGSSVRVRVVDGEGHIVDDDSGKE